MQREQINSLQEELRLFVSHTQNRLAGARESIQEFKNALVSQPPPEEQPELNRQSELHRSAITMDRLQAIKRRLAEQIDNT